MNEDENLEFANIALDLDPDDQHVRRFLQLSGQVFAYGGSSGNLFRLDLADNSSTLVRRWDNEEIRAISVAPDGRRVVVGFEGGTTELYSYQSYNQEKDSTHPFIDIDGLSLDNNESLLSQSDNLSSPRQGENMKSGPTSDTPIRSVLFLDNQYVAVSSESQVFVWDTAKAAPYHQFLDEDIKKQHDGRGCRALELISKQTRSFCALGMDGVASYWDCSSDDPAGWKMLQKDSKPCVAQRDDGEVLSDFDGAALNRACHPRRLGNDLLALPGTAYWQFRAIKNSAANSIQLEDIFHEIVESTHISGMIAFATCGDADTTMDRYCVSIGRDGHVILWENVGSTQPLMKKKRVLKAGIKPGPTDICFHNGTLLISTADANVLTCSDLCNKAGLQKKKEPDTHETAQAEETTDMDGAAEDKEASDTTQIATPDVAVKSPVKQRKRLEKLGGGSNDKEDDDDDDISFTVSTKSTAPSKFVDEEAADGDSDSEPGQDGNALKDSAVRSSGLEDDNSDKDSVGSVDTDDLNLQSSGPAMTMQNFHLPEPQAAFAPSATPLDLARRFLVWNHVGSITLNKGEESRNTVTINFNDAGFRSKPTVSFTDNMGFIVGSLCEEGAIFASDLADDEEDDNDDVIQGMTNLSDRTKTAVKRSRTGNKMKATGSTVYFNRFETFGKARDKDWYLTLPSGERVLGCACGDGWSAVATNRRFVRLFTSGGNQDHLFWLDGDPVTMVGRSRFLAVFYHLSQPLMDGTQKLGYMLYDSMANRTIGKGSVSCISPKATLRWVGFSAELSLFAMDSSGMLSQLISPETGCLWEWMPMLDTQIQHIKSPGDSFWPISICKGAVSYVPLKGGVTYPNAARRPVASKAKLRLPFARGPIQKTVGYEELTVRAGVALQQKRVMHEYLIDGDEDEAFEKEFAAASTELDKVTIRMFADTIDAGKLEKALDLVERFTNEASFDIAMQLADNHRKLVELIEAAKFRKFGDPVFESHHTEPLFGNQISPESDQGRRPKRPFSEV